jgi:nucleoside 2-deoxyribosyltransferase
MIRVYTAGKLTSGFIFRDLHDRWPYVYFHARWLKHNKIGTPDTRDHATRFWVEDEQDVRSADVLLVYADKGEHLRGALVEVGIAIACGVPVVVVGKHEDYGTWQYHPGVTKVKSLEQAGEYLQMLDDQQWAKQNVIFTNNIVHETS